MSESQLFREYAEFRDDHGMAYANTLERGDTNPFDEALMKAMRQLVESLCLAAKYGEKYIGEHNHCVDGWMAQGGIKSLHATELYLDGPLEIFPSAYGVEVRCRVERVAPNATGLPNG